VLDVLGKVIFMEDPGLSVAKTALVSYSEYLFLIVFKSS